MPSCLHPGTPLFPLQNTQGPGPSSSAPQHSNVFILADLVYTAWKNPDKGRVSYELMFDSLLKLILAGGLSSFTFPWKGGAQ